MKKIRTLLDIIVYEATGTELGELRKRVNHDRHFINDVIPEYCLHVDSKNVRRSDEYLHWVEEGNQKYTLFDAQTTDKLLGEEISNAGLVDLLKGYDFEYILQTFKKHKIDDRFMTLPASEYLIIELEYTGGNSYFNSDDFELHINPIEKLNLYNLGN